MASKRSEYLLKNTAIFTIGNIGSKLITFFLIPLYTNVLSTSEYGTVDLINTIGMIVAPLLVLNIGESVMRFSLDKGADHNKILTVGCVVYTTGLIIGVLIIPISTLFDITRNYGVWIYFYTVLNAGTTLFLCYLRGKELLTRFAFGNILSTLMICIFNILFLVHYKMGIEGYLFAYIFSSLITIVYTLWAGRVWSIFQSFSFDRCLLLKMAKYSVVLVPNTFMWWIMNSSDRIMVIGMIGAAANGIYAISYKLPTIVSSFTQIFCQAWSYSAIREEGASDEEDYSNSIFKCLIAVTTLIGLTIITFAKPFLRIYVASEFYTAWQYIPFLTVGSVYLAFGTFIATSYSVHKDSVGMLLSSMLGAVTNIALNYLLIRVIGIYGAALATCVSYIAVFIFRFVQTRKYIRYSIANREFILGAVLLIVDSCLSFINTFWGVGLQIAVLGTAAVLYKEYWFLAIKTLLRRFMRGNG